MSVFDSKQPLLPIVALMTFIAGGMLFISSPFKSSRPRGDDVRGSADISTAPVVSRLWQDPFVPLNEFLLSDKSKEFFKIYDSASVFRNNSKSGQVHLFYVFLSSNPYPEEGEIRLRQRYALAMSLAAEKYVPERPDRLSVVRMPWPEVREMNFQKLNSIDFCESDTNRATNLEFPYEIFQNSANSSSAIVCWLPGEQFENFPLSRLALLTDYLLRDSAYDKSRVKISIFAGGLDTFVVDPLLPFVDFKGDERQAREVFEGHSTFVSAWSTTPDYDLFGRRTGHSREFTEAQFEAKGIEFMNVLATDDALCKELVKELELRGVKPRRSNEGDLVVLLSDWDRAYGRSLPELFRQEFYATALSEEDRRGVDNNLVVFNYLRGVDSEPNPAGKTSGKGKAKSKSDSDDASSTGIEQPEGGGQLDYVRRLGTELRALEARRGTRVGAIGVLGSDVYDKLLLLQHMRALFPEALFFTTDLDARLAHPDQLKWSRNLIVASSYDLKLSARFQKSIPPFRDCYQTALFLGGHAVINSGTSLPLPPPPLLFEIGNSRPVRLNTAASSIVHPPGRSLPSAATGARALLIILAACFVVFLLVLQLNSKVAHHLRRGWEAFRSRGKPAVETSLTFRKTHFSVLASLFVLLPIILILAIAWDHVRPGGEPFTLLEGVSTWPADILRTGVILTTLALFLRIRVKVRQNKLELSERYHLVPAFQGKAQAENWWKDTMREELRDPDKTIKWRRYWRAIQPRTISLSPKSDPEFAEADQQMTHAICSDKISARKLWAYYNWLGFFQHRLVRTCAVTFLYFVAGLLLAAWFGFPVRPYRGTINGLVDVSFLFGAVLCQIFLTFYVLDATRLCRVFIRNLTHAPTEWPDSLLTETQRETGLPRPLLDDYLDIRLISERTAVIGKLIFYPFFIVFFSILCRSSYFDRWSWTPALIVLLSVNSLLALLSVLLLRNAAERARQKAIDNLRAQLIRAYSPTKPPGDSRNPAGDSKHSSGGSIPSEGASKEAKPADDKDRTFGAEVVAAYTGLGPDHLGNGSGNSPNVLRPIQPAGPDGALLLEARSTLKPRFQADPADDEIRPRPEQITLLIKEIEANEEGAFAPLAKHPVIGAVLMPLGGASVLFLLEFFSKIN